MKLDKFILSYNGNKYRECKHLDFINVHDYDIIVEPFCGIFGFSRYLFEKNPTYTGKFYLNDIDTNLIDFYNQLKNKDYSTIEKYTFDESLPNLELKKTIKGLTIPLNIYKSVAGTICNTTNGLKRIRNFNEKKPEYEDFFSHCNFFNMPHDQFIDQLPKDKRILIFYDPPYFNSSNQEYIKFCEKDYIEPKDSTQMYMDIFSYFESKHEFDHLLVINQNALLDYIFKPFFYKKYGKTYSNSCKTKVGNRKNKANHMIYFIHNVVNEAVD